MTAPVEALRSAAVLLRQRAEAATAGPWVVNHDDMWSVVRSEAPSIEWEYQREVMTTHTPDEVWPDSVYIATVHPLVGLALADLFDRFAVEWGRIEAPALQDLVGDHPLLALARQILAEQADDSEPVGRPVETVHLPVLGDSS